MSDKYYRGLRNFLNATKHKLQLASMTLKINENKNSISGIKNDISGINNFSDKIDTNTSNISDNSDLININKSSISNISEFILKSDKDFEKTYNIELQTFRFNKDNHFFTIFEKEIEHDFIKNSLLFVKNNMYYKYDNLSNDYHRCQHEYNIYDDENNFIHKYLFNKDMYYNENSNILNTSEEFCIYLKKNYNKIKIVLELHRHNRHGFGNINFEIDDNNNYIKVDYIEKGFLDNSHLINLNTGSISTNSGKIDKNASDISSNLGKINTNTSSISSNLGKITDNSGLINTNLEKINDIENDIKIFIDPYNETFIFSNRTTSSESQIIFEKIINFDFSKDGVFNILANFNYEYDTKYNFNHTYHFFNNDNDELLKKEIITNNVVKNEFKFENTIDISSLKILIYISDNVNNKTIKLLSNSSLQFKYSKIEFKTDINKNNVKSNLDKIDKNTSDIANNLSKIESITKSIFMKNLLNILYYDVDVKISDMFFEKSYVINAKKTDFLEIQFKILLIYDHTSNAKFVNTIFTLYDDDDTKLYWTSYNNSDYINDYGTNDVLLQNYIYFTFDRDITNLKIRISFTWTRPNIDITYSSSTTDRLIIKHYGN